MEKLLTIVFALFIIGYTNATIQQDETRQERILLTDPDVIGARLANMEQTIQKLTQTVTSLQTELAEEKKNVSQLQSKLLQVQTDLVTEKDNVSHLQNKLLQVQAEFGREKANVSLLQTELAQVKTDLAKEKIDVSLLQNALSQERENLSKIARSVQNLGSTYVRWGRKQCPTANTDTIYSGFTSGQPYYYSSQYYSGPANRLCLPKDPNVSNRTAPGGSLLFGSEFNEDFFTKGALSEDVPCALCRSKNTVSSVMFPGRNTCYSGWKLEYQGILASGAINHRPSSYICVDRHPEFLQGGERSNGENLLYAVTTKCGSLPCPPYVNNMEINCVVCSK